MIRFFAAFIFIGFIGCHSAASSATESFKSDSENVLIIETLLQIQFNQSITEDIPLVIEETLSIEMLFMHQTMSEFSANLVDKARLIDKRLVEAVTDFCSKNSESKVDSFSWLSINHIILTDTKILELFGTEGKDGWEEFYKAFPNSPGIITLSQPGFSADGDLAVIYMGNQLHWLAGKGRIYVYEKKQGKWVKSELWLLPSWIA